jgi:hypothetical protein
MKNGRWIGGLLLALLAHAPHLRAGEVQWQAAASPARQEDPGVTLGRPEALRETPALAPAAPAPSPSGMVLLGYEVPQSPAEKPARLPATLPDIIAVSAPVLPPAPPPAPAPEEEPIETQFAIDRPLRPRLVGRRPSSPIVQASAEVPNWNADWFTEPPSAPLVGASEELACAAPLPSGRSPRFYASGEYLLWWLQGQQVPVPATTSNPQDFGILGAPSTQVLFGGNGINTGPFSGGRFTVGYVLGCREAIEITGFFLGPRAANFSTASFDHPVIGRPFMEVNNGQESAQLTALPGVAAGMLTIHAPTFLWGLEGNLRCLLCCGCNWRLSALAGFRNINLDERLTITENIQGLSTAPPPFTNQTITVIDSFRTQNHFYGGQGGIAGRWYWGRWSLDGWGKVALGANVQILDISGSQRFVSPTGVVQNFTGGLLAEPSNIGHFSHTVFSVVPEVGLNVGYQIRPYLRGFVGYNFLYWSNVIWPGTSIDRGIDVTQIPNFPLNPAPAPVAGRHPAPIFHEVGFWAQGITFGLEFVY